MIQRLSLLPMLVTSIMLSQVLGCSSGHKGSSEIPVVAGNNPDVTEAGYIGSTSHVLWGFYEISIDPSTLKASVQPLRSAEFNVNVTKLMQPPISPVNRITIHLDAGASDIPSGLFAVDITLSHPFPGMSQYAGFDVRGIFMSNGSVPSSHYAGLAYASSDEAKLVNPDGWTRWWNPSEFTGIDTIFGYTKGTLSSPGFTATATLNPYKYFCDGLFSQDEMAVNPESRGFFSAGGSNKRRYMIQFPVSGDKPLVKFNYAIDASWFKPDPSGVPEYKLDDFSLSANCQEAYQVSVADAGSTAWYVSDTQNGGHLMVDIIVYDWQSSTNPSGVPGEVSAIWAESPTLLDTPVDILPLATAWPDGPTSSVFRAEIDNITPTGLIGQTILVGVESKSPLDYSPQLPGVSGFAYPNAPLAAYMFWDAPIKNEGAKEVPYPTGLDNCAAAGIVELYWDAVTWPTLTGYNLYRKESTEPSYDFKAPLNSQPLTGTYFEDKSVATDGTSYDYVVTSVDLDSTESLPSNQTTADPQYRTPSGFTDLEAPDDGTIGDQVVLNTVSAAVDGKGKVYVVWDHDVDWPTFGISLANGNMLDGTSGATFEVGEGDNPDVAFDSKGNAHVVWGFGSGDGANPKEYYYAEVDPSGSVSNLTKLHTFTYGNWWSVQPTIAVTPDDEVHIVFTGYLMKYGIVYVHGAPGNFSEPEMLASNVTAFLAMADPDLVSDHDGNLHLIWIGPDFATLNYMKRDTSGAWSDQVVAAQAPDFQEIYRPGLAVDRLGVVHISWNQQDPNGVNYPYYIDNRSGAFENPLQLETEVITNGAVQIACDRDGNAYVIWYTDLDPGSGFNWQSFVGLVDWNGDIIAKQKVSSDTGYSGVMPVIAGVTDTCFAGEASVIGVWAARPDLPPQFGRIRTDY